MHPVYFKAMVGSVGLALFGHLMGQRTRNKADLVQACNLLGSILSVLVNLLFLEPKAAKRVKLEKEEGRGRERTCTPTKLRDTVVADAAGPVTTTSTTTSVAAATTTTSRLVQNEAKSELAKLDDRLKKLNSYLSLLNISTLIGLTWHLIYLSRCLRVDNS